MRQRWTCCGSGYHFRSDPIAIVPLLPGCIMFVQGGSCKPEHSLTFRLDAGRAPSGLGAVTRGRDSLRCWVDVRVPAFIQRRLARISGAWLKALLLRRSEGTFFDMDERIKTIIAAEHGLRILLRRQQLYIRPVRRLRSYGQRWHDTLPWAIKAGSLTVQSTVDWKRAPQLSGRRPCIFSASWERKFGNQKWCAISQCFHSFLVPGPV